MDGSIGIVSWVEDARTVAGKGAVGGGRSWIDL